MAHVFERLGDPVRGPRLQRALLVLLLVLVVSTLIALAAILVADFSDRSPIEPTPYEAP